MCKLTIVPIQSFKLSMFQIMTDSMTCLARDNGDVACQEARHMMAMEPHKWIVVYDPHHQPILSLHRGM